MTPTSALSTFVIGLTLVGASPASRGETVSSQPPPAASRNAGNITLVGAYKSSESRPEALAGSAVFKKLAFLGKWSCPDSGVEIVDISRPSAPIKVAETSAYPGTTKAEMEAIEVGARDVLGIAMQACGPAGRRGLELVDITDPHVPRTLGFFDTTPSGVVELDLTRTPTGSTLALLASAHRELFTSSPSFSGGIGDLLIVDISDPANPRLVGEWGVLDEPALGPAFYAAVRRGGFPETFLHTVRANADGTRAYLSYWDAGHIILDISDPAKPKFLGRASTPMTSEGNAHSADEGRGGNILVTATEDFAAFEPDFRIATGPNAGQYPSIEGAFTRPIGSLTDKTMNGTTTFVGLACSPSGVPPAADDGDPLTDAIAVVQRGLCNFDEKASVVAAGGYDGFIVFNSTAGGDEVFRMGSAGTAKSQLPGVMVGHSTGLRIFNVDASSALAIGQAGVIVDVRAVFNGWGYMTLFDISDPANPTQVGTFATENVTNEAVANTGLWSIHDPEVRGNTVYASWYADGVRVIDITNPAIPREIGFWRGAGAPDDAPAVDIWSVLPHGALLVASDRNYGLYLLKLAKP